MTPRARLRRGPQPDYLALSRGSHRGARRQYSSYFAPNFRLSAGSLVSSTNTFTPTANPTANSKSAN